MDTLVVRRMLLEDSLAESEHAQQHSPPHYLASIARYLVEIVKTVLWIPLGHHGKPQCLGTSRQEYEVIGSKDESRRGAQEASTSSPTPRTTAGASPTEVMEFLAQHAGDFERINGKINARTRLVNGEKGEVPRAA